MKLVTNFPLFDGCLREYGDMAGLARDYRELGLDGLEVIWDHNPYTEELPPPGLAIGYHLTFNSYWIDFWRGRQAELLREFGTSEIMREYFRADTPDAYVNRYREDLQRAIDLGSEYAVFHVSDVSIEECFTYRFAHSDREIIDCATELINRILDGMDVHLAFLVENQWWPGFTFTDPAMTRRLLDGIEYENKGIMLDTGHLLHTNTRLRTQEQAVAYIHEMIDAHGDTAQAIRGMHLQQSLTGSYVEEWGFKVPDDLTGDYWQKFTRVYEHILSIDQHHPWTDPAIATVVDRINPEWLNNELSAWPRAPHREAVATQLDALRRGGLPLE